MLLVLRDPQDRLEACIDYYLVDEAGKFDPFGAFIFVRQLELNPGIGGGKIIRHFIQEISRLCPTARFGYWERRDKVRKKFRIWGRTQLLRRRDVDVAVA